jgi:hypothetical protein
MKAQARASEQSYPDTNAGTTAVVTRFSENRLRDRDQTRSYLGIVLGVVLIVFLIAVTNVAGLRLVDLKDRESEISLRRALGASRARIARQFLVENALLYAIAFVASLLVAWLSLRLLERLNLFRIAISELDLRLDSRALLAALGVALAGAVFGSVAASFAEQRLQSGSSRIVGKGSRARGGFLVVQVALSLPARGSGHPGANPLEGLRDRSRVPHRPGALRLGGALLARVPIRRDAGAPVLRGRPR